MKYEKHDKQIITKFGQCMCLCTKEHRLAFINICTNDEIKNILLASLQANDTLAGFIKRQLHLSLNTIDKLLHSGFSKKPHFKNFKEK
ncbi:MAG TPA: hypothetical protein ENI76_06325 [Ignavibacteria bacterium]|nr:hypothetical protein [Ignavibacteria bacterium]